MYRKVDSGMNFAGREKEVLEFWKQNKIFDLTLEKTKNGKEFSFYDGPPTANGKPHIGHILTRVMKDIVPRYKTMKGWHVRRQAGWDTHGLPVELEVEKTLGIDGKQDIEKYGIEPFIKKCKESVWKYQSEWERMSERVGYWVDMEKPYVTYDDNYIESIWWSLKNISDKGLIYKGHKIVPYCPRCGTALSSHEVAQGYKDVEEKSIVAKFKVTGEENTYILAWTTTPWTLPSNVALCVNPKEEYSKILVESGETYILATALLSKHFTENYKIVESFKGAKLEHTKYEPLFNYAVKGNEGKAWYVVTDDFVTLTDGTGVVHIAPAFGEDDAKVGKKYNLPFVQMVDERGRFIAAATDFFDKFCKDADKEVIKNLKSNNKLFSEAMYKHSYPYCWRCDTPLLYYARSTWFISMTKLRDSLVANNNTINWMPETIGKNRFGNFLEGVVDWGLSRERYWGTPLPIWVCECGHTHTVGSKDELKRLGGLTTDIELHKPYVDAVKIKCSACGKTMSRTPEVIDCWYDSGSMPFAQLHYPFENKELFEKTFPADFISEAVDQTRGWFYTLLAISTLLFDKSPYKNCLVLGHVCDKNGEKMSKHKGNVVDPWSVLDVQGADAVRWYFYTASSPWLPSRFYADAVSEAQRKFMGTLWNVYSFFVLYAEIDKFNPAEYPLDKRVLSTMDKWLLSELNVLIKETDENLDKYRITESARRIQEFTDVLSNWYVRRCRERYWGSGMNEDKAAAFSVLYHTLTELAKLIAPFVPFMAESIYSNLVPNFIIDAPVSVHLCDYPKADEKYIDRNLSARMNVIINAASAGRTVRSANNIKNRQTLSKMYIALTGEAPDNELLEVVKDEINVLEVSVISDAAEFVRYELKPQLKTLGPKYGAKINTVRKLLEETPSEILAKVKADGIYKTVADGVEIELKESDLLISVKNKDGYNAESCGGVTVILDTVLTPELIELGAAREVISKIQSMRKEYGLVVTDRIKVRFSTGSEFLVKTINSQKAKIAAVLLADSIEKGKVDGADKNSFVKELEINDEKIEVSLTRVK